jgi:hypothetical protein
MTKIRNTSLIIFFPWTIDPTGKKSLVNSCKMNVFVLEKKNEGYEQQSRIFKKNSEDQNIYIYIYIYIPCFSC